MTKPYRKVRYSDALRYMMKHNAHELAKLKGGEPQGKCIDCRRELPAEEIAVKCDQCNRFVCVNCIDKHVHEHDSFSMMGQSVVSGANPA
jgi:Zn finger protein HypA/HybF involved in hydrogenase expression